MRDSIKNVISSVVHILWSCILVVVLVIVLTLFGVAITSCSGYNTTLKACYIDESGRSSCMSAEFEPLPNIKNEK